MKDKGLESEITLSSTPGFVEPDDKPLNQSNNQAKKVDINVLKARVQEIQNKDRNIK